MRHFAFLIILLTVTLASADDLIFHSPFVSGEGKSEIGSKWEVGHGKWIVKDGELTGKQLTEDGHAAGVKTRIDFPENFKFDFEFNFNGAKKLNVRFVNDGKKIFIINIQKKQYRFQIEKGEAGKTGNFMTDASKSFSFKNDKWYKGSLIVNGKNYSLKIGDNEVLKGSNELITRKKNLLLFNIGGESASIRNVKIYK